jgi:hypothetical protein
MISLSITYAFFTGLPICSAMDAGRADIPPVRMVQARVSAAAAIPRSRSHSTEHHASVSPQEELPVRRRERLLPLPEGERPYNIASPIRPGATVPWNMSYQPQDDINAISGPQAEEVPVRRDERSSSQVSGVVDTPMSDSLPTVQPDDDSTPTVKITQRVDAGVPTLDSTQTSQEGAAAVADAPTLESIAKLAGEQADQNTTAQVASPQKDYNDRSASVGLNGSAGGAAHAHHHHKRRHVIFDDYTQVVIFVLMNLLPATVAALFVSLSPSRRQAAERVKSQAAAASSDRVNTLASPQCEAS